MAQQDEGWPLGLRPLNARLNGLMRSPDFSGSLSFNTLLTASPTSSTISSSDLDTQSTGSFFHDRSKTLGSLIGVSSIIEVSRRSSRVRRRTTSSENLREENTSFKSKPWIFSLCSKLSTDAVTVATNTPSLAHFLEAERRVAAAANTRRNHIPIQYGPADYSPVDYLTVSNSLFANNDLVAPRQSPAASGAANIGIRSNNELLQDGNGFGVPLLFPCSCGQLIK